MFKRILILSASVGNGHVTAAESLKKAFEIKGLADVRHEDVLKFTKSAFSASLQQGLYRFGKQHARGSRLDVRQS